MTTKVKIILGIVTMIALMAMLAVIGYRGLDTASSGFTEYRRLARLNVFSSDMQTSMSETLTALYKFATTEESSLLVDAKKSLENVANLAGQANDFTRLPEHTQTFNQISTEAKALAESAGRIETALGNVVKQYTQVVLPGGHQMGQQLVALHEASLRLGNASAATIVMTSMSQLGTVRSAASRFSQSRIKKDGDRVLEVIAQFKQSLGEIEKTIETPEGKRLFESLSQAFNSMHGAITDMVARCDDYQKTLAQINATTVDIDSRLANLSSQFNENMTQQGPRTLESNQNAQQMAILCTVIGLLLGAIIGLYLVMGLIRALKQLANYAEEVAQGHFESTPKIKEKGEMGAVVEAIQSIPKVLRNVILESRELTGHVRHGKYRTRIDASHFQQGFAELTSMFNEVSDSYTNVLDIVPVPIIACDKNIAVQFLNKSAQGTLGGNLEGESYTKHLCAEGRTDSQSFGQIAMTRDAAYTDETTIRPQGVLMNVSATTTPLHDEAGSVVGFLELLTDLTEIKNKQNTILRVAEQASHISNRVAAASEQLSAQVEQVSRGAEMQRSRVESTASAMTEMNSTVLEVARNAGQASEQSEQTRDKANEGSNLVNQVVQSIHKVNEVTSALHVNMQELGAQAESIGGVMNVISDIADQTNLLALNAAIEAARAGEAGRGFAVVADEVRKLAEKTMQATQEVGGNIAAIQNSTQVNVKSVAEASKAVEQSTELVNASGNALTEIVALASSSSAIVASIATAAEEQSATSEEINHAIDEINHVVAETTDGMNEASQAVQELSHMAQELNRVLEELQ